MSSGRARGFRGLRVTAPTTTDAFRHELAMIRVLWSYRFLPTRLVLRLTNSGSHRNAAKKLFLKKTGLTSVC